MQDLPRLHVEPAVDPVDGAELPMTPGQAHYLGAVMRRQPGDRVRLFNAAIGEWQAEIVFLRKERGLFRLGGRLRPPAAEHGPVLVFAPLKRDATDLVVRMATELGVFRLQPVTTERTNAARINAARWLAIAMEAAEQCERLGVPAIAEPLALPELLAGWDPFRPLLAALERDPEAARQGIGAWRAGNPAAQPGLLVGPEGGFSPNERNRLRACPFVVPVGLGPLILRAETAALAGLAALLG